MTWEKTPPPGKRCALTGLATAANGPYFVDEGWVLSAAILREVTAAENSPYVLSTKAELEALNARLTERVAEFQAEREKVSHLETQLKASRSRKKAASGD